MDDSNDDLWELLNEIAPTTEDYINKRIHKKDFARIIIWLIAKGRSDDYIYSSELREFLKLSSSRSYDILTDLCSVKIMKRKTISSNLNEFWFVKDLDNFPVVNKYFEKAKKTLGINFKMVLNNGKEK